MHYGDKLQLRKQKLVVTAYRDQAISFNIKTGDDEIHADYITIESILECHAVRPQTICELHHSFKYIMNPYMDNMKNDTYYIIELKYDGDTFTVKKLKEVTKQMAKKNPLLALH